MEKLRIIQGLRTAPGVILFDPKGRVRYVSEEALELIPSLGNGSGSKGKGTVAYPKELTELIDQMTGLPPRSDPFAAPFFHHKIMAGFWGVPLSLRGISLIPPGSVKKTVHHLVLVEAIVEKRKMQDSQVQDTYNLSDREMEVLRLVCGGSTNREISARLFLSPHTVKDHVKHIMAKLGVKSRNRIIAAVKNH